jgi:hypothetical protein
MQVEAPTRHALRPAVALGSCAVALLLSAGLAVLGVQDLLPLEVAMIPTFGVCILLVRATHSPRFSWAWRAEGAEPGTGGRQDDM